MRRNYESVAELASALYFALLRLSALDAMYKFSLDFYVKVFRRAIKQAEKS
jgi:dynein heavy chain